MHRPKTCPANSTRCAAMSWNGNLSESSDANLAVFLPPRSYSNKMYSKIIAYATTWTAASVQDLLSIGRRIIDATANACRITSASEGKCTNTSKSWHSHAEYQDLVVRSTSVLMAMVRQVLRTKSEGCVPIALALCVQRHFSS